MKKMVDLNALVNPKSVCIIGATEKSLFVRNLVKNLESQGFGGKLYMINPKYQSLFGYSAYPTVLDVPGEVDNAVCLIPALGTVEAVKQCAQKGVKSITIVTSGFAENGRTGGEELQRQITEIALKNNISICGPNCFGTISSHAQVANFCEKIPGNLKKGNVGAVMQSGGLTNCLMNLAQNRGVDFSYFISSGNEAVLESSDYMNFMLDDPNTDVICGFVEGVKDKEKFSRVADLALERKKPIILIKIGRSANGADAAFRHTGAITGVDSEFDALCRKKGIIRLDDLDDMIETASLFSKMSKRWRRVGRRVGVITVSGGGAGLVADVGTQEGFEFPKISDEAAKFLGEIVPEFGFVSNPLDMTAQVFGTPANYLKCAECLIREEQLDIVGFAWTLGIPKEFHPISTIIEGLSGIARQTHKLCILFSVSNVGLNDYGKDLLKKCDIPFVQGARRTFRAINSLMEYTMLINEL